MFPRAVGTNYHKLDGLNNRKQFFHCSGVRNQGVSRTALPLEGRVCPLPLTPSAVAADTSLLRSHYMSLCLHLHITFSFVCLISLCLSLMKTLVVVFRAHLDNSRLSLHLKTLKLITSLQTLPCKTIFRVARDSGLISLGSTIQTTTYTLSSFHNSNTLQNYCIMSQYDIDTTHRFYSDFPSLTCTHLLVCALILYTCVFMCSPPVKILNNSSTTKIPCVALL